MSRALLAFAVAAGLLVLALLLFLRPRPAAVAATKAGSASTALDRTARLEPPAARDEASTRAPAASAPGNAAERGTPPEPAHPLRVRLIEEPRGLALAGFRVKPESGAVLESDDGAWITLPAVAPGSALELELCDNLPGIEDLLQTRKQDWAAAMPGSIQARIEAPAELVGGELPPVDLRLRCADARKAFDRAFARVRAGPLPWARFGACASFLGGGPPWTVELALTACGRLVGRVLTEAREPVRKQWVQIVDQAATSGPAPERPRFASTDVDGRFDAPRLRPGTYELRVETEGFEPFETTATLAAGTTVEREIELAASTAPKGSLRVRVESATGAYSKVAAVVPEPVEGGASPEMGKLQWSDEDGGRVGHATFADLEVREYRLRLSLPDLFPISPEALVVRPAGQEMSCRIEDDVRTVRLRIHQVDDATGEPAPGATAEVRTRGPGKPAGLRGNFESGTITFDDLPVDAQVLVRIDAPEHAPFWATERELVRAEHEWTLDARLRAGWGTEVLVVASDGSPIEGARVRFDGVEVGISDATGRVLAALPARPARAEVHYRDWTLGPGSGLQPDGSFRDWERWLRVVLTPP